jgi:hypothetical protein
MSMSFEKSVEDHAARNVRDDAASPQDRLERAHVLASEIDGLLNAVSHELADTDNFRVRLARAHTLSLLDQLAELIGTRGSADGPTVRSCATRDRTDDENATSGVRRARAWR